MCCNVIVAPRAEDRYRVQANEASHSNALEAWMLHQRIIFENNFSLESTVVLGLRSDLSECQHAQQINFFFFWQASLFGYVNARRYTRAGRFLESSST